MELRTDLGNKQCGEEHAHAYFRDGFCALGTEQFEMSGYSAVEYDKEHGETGLNGSKERLAKTCGCHRVSGQKVFKDNQSCLAFKLVLDG